MLTFITWNQHKFEEVIALIPTVKQSNLDLDEIQELDPKVIISRKLQQAKQFCRWMIMVEDVWLYFPAMNNFPWPLIKRYLKSNSLEKIVNILEYLGDTRATAQCMIWLLDENGNEKFFEWSVHWTVKLPAGDTKFWWDPIFVPDWSDKSFGQMSLEEKNSISHRFLAVNNLKLWLADNNLIS